MKDISDQLRAAVIESPLSLYKIALESGVSYGQLHRFVNGDRDLSLTTAAMLARWARLELRPVSPSPAPSSEQER